MPYVQRDLNGIVIGKFSLPQPDVAEEFLEEGHPDLIEQPVIPLRVTMRQARLALLQAGLLDDVAAAIEAMQSPQKEAAQIEWEYSQEVHRDKALVLALAPALGLDHAALDQLFITAATL